MVEIQDVEIQCHGIMQVFAPELIKTRVLWTYEIDNIADIADIRDIRQRVCSYD